jgi:hypothetical protein
MVNRFGWLPPPSDGRDQQYRVRALRPQLQAAQPAILRKQPYHEGILLDQGDTPKCVSNSGKGFLLAAPLMSKFDFEPSIDLLYDMAQDRDEWPGKDYAGTSQHGQMKAMQDLGLIDTYAWGQTTEEAVHWLLYDYGTLLAGTNWYAEMSQVDSHGFMREPAPSMSTPIGGHAYRLVWFVQKPDPTDSYFILRNSWGHGFGWPDAKTKIPTGYAKMSVRLFERLQSESGELAAPTQLRLKPVKP